MRVAMFWLGMVFSVGAFAQELPRQLFTFWTPADTAQVIRLVNKGHQVMFRNLDSALPYFYKAVEISHNKGFDNGAGYALSYVGYVQASKGNLPAAYQAYQEALGYCKHPQTLPIALPSVYINMAVTYKSVGRYELANRYYYKALRYLEERMPGNPNILVIYNNLANVHAALNQFSRAMAYAKKAEMLSRQQHNKNTEVSSLANIGTLYLQMNMPDSALSCLLDALAIARDIGHVDKEQFVLTNIGALYKETGQPAKAITYYRKAMQLNQETHPLYNSILPAYALGEAFLQTGQYAEAERVLRKAVAQSEQSGVVTGRHTAYKTLSTVYEKKGDPDKALLFFKKYERLNDSLTGIAKATAINEAETRYQVEQKDKLLAENSLKLLRQQHMLNRNKMQTTIGIIAVGLLVIIVGVIFYYRSKMERRSRHMTYWKAIIDGEEKERDRVARELHDGIGGMLTVMQLNIAALMDHEDIRPTELSGLAFLASHIGEEVHKTARNLTPHILQHHNLYQALIHYCEQFEQNSHLRIRLQFMGATDRMNKSLELVLFRIIQELIQNIYKHANASTAIIQLRADDRTLYLSAEDDGCGFDTGGLSGGLGLQHIQNRIEALNGFCSIESAPGKGTSVFIEINQNNIPE